MKINVLLLSFLVASLFFGCDYGRDQAIDDFASMPARESEPWVRDAVIYEVYLRSFSPEGTFAGLEQRLPELRDLGVSVLWLMPIHPVGQENKKGTLGSPYSIQDYFDVNPEFGTMEDFRRLLNAVHEHGMKLIIDLVANHTAWDNPLITEQKDWYVQNDRGEIVHPAGTDWWDVADLNYDNPEVWEYMKEVMRFWVEDIGIDGFRCDVSELVPTEFWEEAREMLDAIKPVMMISEGTLPAHQIYAFDITYSWNLYHALPGIVHSEDPATAIDELLLHEANRYPVGSLRMRFKSNHDENAWDAPAVEKWGPEGTKAVGTLVTTIPGVPLLYNGDEVGNPKRLGLFERVPIAWETGDEYRNFYTGLFSLYNESFVFRKGEFTKIPTTEDNNIYSFIRWYDGDIKYVLINLKPDDIIFEVMGGVLLGVGDMQSGTLSKKFGHGSDVITFASEDMVSLSLPGYGYAIYNVR